MGCRNEGMNCGEASFLTICRTTDTADLYDGPDINIISVNQHLEVNEQILYGRMTTIEQSRLIS